MIYRIPFAIAYAPAMDMVALSDSIAGHIANRIEPVNVNAFAYGGDAHGQTAKFEALYGQFLFDDWATKDPTPYEITVLTGAKAFQIEKVDEDFVAVLPGGAQVRIWMFEFDGKYKPAPWPGFFFKNAFGFRPPTEDEQAVIDLRSVHKEEDDAHPKGH